MDTEENLFVLKDVEQMPDFPTLEKGIMQFWENTQAFQKLVKKNKNNKKWSFFDGPITANNPMGVHHAWGRTYKDIFIRHRAMQVLTNDIKMDLIAKVFG